jgi:hypothetical protein
MISVSPIRTSVTRPLLECNVLRDMSSPKYWIFALLIGTSLRISAAADSPVGVWRGDSLCTTDAPACKNEKVVYYIEAVADKPDHVSIRADKIVDGKAITMGISEWEYDQTKQTLSWQPNQRLWLLNINGKRMEGTLTVPGNVVFRRMTLKKDE